MFDATDVYVRHGLETVKGSEYVQKDPASRSADSFATELQCDPESVERILNVPIWRRTAQTLESCAEI